MTNLIKVYIAGPYSEGNPAENTGRAMVMWHTLTDLGYLAVCPHLNHFLEIIKKKPYDYWMEYDEVFLDMCDCILRLPGTSPGADREVAYALESGKKVFDNIEELVAALPANIDEENV